VLTAGDRVPQATVFLGPNEPVTLDELVEDGLAAARELQTSDASGR